MKSNDVRYYAWPSLLYVEEKKPHVFSNMVRGENVGAVHRDQIEKDILRCIAYDDMSMYKGNNPHHRKKLESLIITLLGTDRQLYYYQGFHEYCNVVLIVLGSSVALKTLRMLSVVHIRPFLRETFDHADLILKELFPLVSIMDGKVGEHITKSGVNPIVCLSWIITWFSHDLHNFKSVARLFDLFLSSHPLLPLYAVASLICHDAESLTLQACEYSSMHIFISLLPRHLEDEKELEGIIYKTLRFFHDNEPSDNARLSNLCNILGISKDWRKQMKNYVDSDRIREIRQGKQENDDGFELSAARVRGQDYDLWNNHGARMAVISFSFVVACTFLSTIY